MPTFFQYESPLSWGAEPQRGQSDGRRLELICLTVGPCWTVEAIKPTGANGEGGVEFAGVSCVGLLLLTFI